MSIIGVSFHEGSSLVFTLQLWSLIFLPFQIAISTDDVYKTAEVIRQNGGQITREPGPLPGINTKITACTDPDGWKTVCTISFCLRITALSCMCVCVCVDKGVIIFAKGCLFLAVSDCSIWAFSGPFTLYGDKLSMITKLGRNLLLFCWCLE